MRILRSLLPAFLALASLVAFADAQTLVRRPIYPAAGGGGIAEVASQRATNSGSGASLALAFPSNVTNTNLVVVGGAIYDEQATFTGISVSDSRSTSYTVYTHTLSGAKRVFIAWGKAPSGGANTVTVTPTGGDGGYDISFSIDEFSGTNASPLDADGGGLDNFGTAVSKDITTLTANALILGVVGHGESAITITPNASYTQIGEIESSTLAHNFIFRLVTTATTYSVAWTLSGSEGWAMYTAAFKP